MPTRRQTLTALGSTALGTLALSATTEESEATRLEIDSLSIPEQSNDVSKKVKAVQLSVNARYQYETTVTPTRAVLRLEAQAMNKQEWSQLDATALSDLSQSKSDTVALSGDLVSLPGVSVGAFNPSERGQTKDVSVDVRLSLSVQKDGEILGEQTATDSVTVRVTKTGVAVDMSLGGTGGVSLTTAE